MVSRANALAVQGYRHCGHVMLHSPVEENCKVFGRYPVKHAVLVSERVKKDESGYIFYPEEYAYHAPIKKAFKTRSDQSKFSLFNI